MRRDGGGIVVRWVTGATTCRPNVRGRRVRYSVTLRPPLGALGVIEGKPMLPPNGKRPVDVNGDPGACSWTVKWVHVDSKQSLGYWSGCGAWARVAQQGSVMSGAVGGILEAATSGRTERSPESDG